MKRNTRAVRWLLLTILFVTPASAQDGFYLKDRDRVVFYGDSITEQRLYTSFVETYVVTRWPELDITFVNAGWSGDRVSGGRGGLIDLRLQRDVIAYHPTVVTIMLGMNDGDVKAYNAALFGTFATGYKHIVETLIGTEPRPRLTLIRPSPYDDVTREPLFQGGYNAVLVRYGDFVQDLARQMKLDPVADLNAPVVAALAKANALDANLAKKIIPDRVHPGPGGHLLMAQALLKAWNAPAIVTDVHIDYAAARVVKADNTTISNLTEMDGISWTQMDRALPMPLDMKDPTTALAVKSSDIVETLDQQMLVVSGLSSPNYVLKIDDETIGAFTKESLAEGINLVTLPTPMVKQAQAVHLLTVERNGIHRARWREVQVPLHDEGSPGVQEALAALTKLEAELIRKQHVMAQSRPHRFQLIPKP
jgi:lysophospholipase L1-like esterase